LQARGHTAMCYEATDNWSLSNLLRINPNAIGEFRRDFPDLAFDRYTRGPDLADRLRERLANADVALVHEWNDPDVVRLIGDLARQLGVRAFFHDTHYRVVLDEPHRQALELERYDGILAYSPSVAERYLALGFQNVT